MNKSDKWDIHQKGLERKVAFISTGLILLGVCGLIFAHGWVTGVSVVLIMAGYWWK